MTYEIDPSDIAHLNQFSSGFCKMMEAEKPVSLYLIDRPGEVELQITDSTGKTTSLLGVPYQSLDPALEYCMVLCNLIKEHPSIKIPQITPNIHISNVMRYISIHEPDLFNLLVSENYVIRNVWIDHFETLTPLESDKEFAIEDFSMDYIFDQNMVVRLGLTSEAFCKMMESEEPTGFVLVERTDGGDLHITDRSGTIQSTISCENGDKLDHIVEHCVVLHRLLKQHSKMLYCSGSYGTIDLSNTMFKAYTQERKLFEALMLGSTEMHNLWFSHFQRMPSTTVFSSPSEEAIFQQTDEHVKDEPKPFGWNRSTEPPTIESLKVIEWIFGKELDVLLQRTHVSDIRCGVDHGLVSYVEFVCQPSVPILPAGHAICQYVQQYITVVNQAILGKNISFSLLDTMLNNNQDLISGDLYRLLRSVKGFVSPSNLGNVLDTGFGFTNHLNRPNYNPTPFQPTAFNNDTYSPSRMGFGGMTVVFDETLVFSDIIDECNGGDGGASPLIGNVAELITRIHSKPETFGCISRRLDGIVRPLMTAALQQGNQVSPALVQLMRMYDVYRQYKNTFN